MTGVRLVFLLRSTAAPISFGDPLVVGSAIVWVVMIGFFLWLLRADHLGGKQIALRTLYAFGFLLVTLIGLQVLTGGHRPTRADAQDDSERPAIRLIGFEATDAPSDERAGRLLQPSNDAACRSRAAGFRVGRTFEPRLPVSADDLPQSEHVVLSTCNRVEIYTAQDETHAVGPRRPEPPTEEQVAEFLSQFHGVPRDDFYGMLLAEKGPEAVRHLFEVSSSLDSMVLGEPQIVNQVKEAYRVAQENNACGPLTHKLFQGAIHVSARVRSETALAEGRVSIASVAVGDFGKSIFDRFNDKTVVVIGAGEMAEETLRYLKDEGVREIVVVNRSLERAERLAADWGGTARPFDELDAGWPRPT